MANSRSFVFVCVFLINVCDSSDVFHEGSKITLKPDVPAVFFGYAIAFNLAESSIIVGAPKATNGRSPVKSGVVFSCKLSDYKAQNVSCTPMNLGLERYLQNDMWFGASLDARPTGKIVICAPRRILPLRGNLKMNGACFLQMKRYKTLIYPIGVDAKQVLRSMKKEKYADYNGDSNSSFISYSYHQFAETGMAVKFAPDNIIVGAPGLLEWSGGVMLYSVDSSVKSIRFSRKPNYNPYFTDDVGPDEYFGYSVESGIFEDGGKTLFVAGGPKSKRGFGVVLVFEPPTREEAPLKILAKLEGNQIGAYFGASLCCLDVNADGRMDLLVGAPNYVKWFHRDKLYDQGTVHVYLNKEQDTGFTLEYSGQVTGSEANGAKFGYTIADLGDLNGDGYNDVAVSAPWEDGGAGAVYIYAGYEHGIKNHYMQRIVASEAKTFGISLKMGASEFSRDKNVYNDLIIGAPETATGYIYRCIPSVEIQTSINIPGVLNLPQNTTNFTAEFCIDAEPQMVYGSFNLELKATVTVDPEDNRATVVGNSKYNISVTEYRTRKNCVEKVITIKPSADLSKPITITFDVEPIDVFQDNPSQFLTSARRISDNSTTHSELDIQLMRDCGEDLICKPWLEMTLQAMSNPYIPGAEKRLGAIIKVINTDEPAFGIHINLTLPSQPKRVPKTCTLRGAHAGPHPSQYTEAFEVLESGAKRAGDLKVMICDLPSPLNRNDSITWEIEFEYTLDMKDMGVTMIDADIDDPVTKRNVSDNDSQYLEIYITPKTNINGSGIALPNRTLSVPRNTLSEGSRLFFLHRFQVTNAGPSDWSDSEGIIKILLSKNVSLITGTVAGCTADRDPGMVRVVTLYCSWSIKAKESLLVELPLRYDLKIEGKSLEKDTTCNITTTIMFIERNNTKLVSITTTTTLVLEPPLRYWIPVIVGTVAGLICLAIISYVIYKRGYLTRKRHAYYKKLQHENPLEENGGSSTSSLSQQESHPNDADAEESSSSSKSSFTNAPDAEEPSSSSKLPSLLESMFPNDGNDDFQI